MTRYLFHISYNGTNYSGWQSQPNASTVQQTIEEAIYKISRTKTSIVGCGRTDAGVHASSYFFHCDLDLGLDASELDQFIYKLNQVFPHDIAILDVQLAHAEFHARFDAMQRSYIYHIHLVKSPFKRDVSFYVPYGHQLNTSLLNKATEVIKLATDFTTFCKVNTDVKTMNCRIDEARWIIETDQLTFHISADRFLRGMVRLIVGACLNIAGGKATIEELKNALQSEKRLSQNWSVPAHGLFLSDIKYLLTTPI